jgi:hypothetical protein
LLGGVFERMTSLSLFNAVLDWPLSMIAPILPSPEAGLGSFTSVLTLAPDLGVMLPLIGKDRVHSWVDATLHTNKANEAKDAGAPTQLWNQHATLVLAVPVGIINPVRETLFRKYCRNLMRSLGKFLV